MLHVVDGIHLHVVHVCEAEKQLKTAVRSLIETPANQAKGRGPAYAERIVVWDGAAPTKLDLHRGALRQQVLLASPLPTPRPVWNLIDHILELLDGLQALFSLFRSELLCLQARTRGQLKMGSLEAPRTRPARACKVVTTWTGSRTFFFASFSSAGNFSVSSFFPFLIAALIAAVSDLLLVFFASSAFCGSRHLSALHPRLGEPF